MLGRVLFTIINAYRLKYYNQMQMYGCWIILTEFSTPFVNNRWFIAIMQKYNPSKGLDFWEGTCSFNCKKFYSFQWQMDFLFGFLSSYVESLCYRFFFITCTFTERKFKRVILRFGF